MLGDYYPEGDDDEDDYDYWEDYDEDDDEDLCDNCGDALTLCACDDDDDLDEDDPTPDAGSSQDYLPTDPKFYQESNKMTEQIGTKSYIAHIISGSSITVFSGGVHTFPSSHLFYKEICDAVKEGDKAKLDKVLNKKNYKEGIELRDDEVLYNGEPLHNTAVTRLFEAKAAGFSITPIVKFLENCQANAFPQVVEKLYDFLETRAMPITEDGCFLGFKYTNEDYWDSHTGKTYRFLPNTHVKATNIENRGKICDLSGEECSGQGIHVGNYSYSGSQPTVVYVKVNPKDVLSCPHGSTAKKIRVWELDVLGRADGKPFEEIIVTSNGESIPYIKGNQLECKYKAEGGKILHLEGEIFNVGNTYIELAEGYKEYVGNETWDGSYKRRLKISNILEIL